MRPGVTMSWASTLNSLSTLCIFSALVFGTVESYTCMHCAREKCESNQGTCEASHGCYSYNQLHTSAGGIPILTQERGCSPSACTPLAFSATLGSGRILGLDTQCCYSEQCNQGSTELSPVPKDQNGIECPACYTENGTFCSPQPLKCRGAETKCVKLMATEADHDTYHLKVFGMGCASENVCHLNRSVTQSLLGLRIYCVNPVSGSLPLTPITLWTLTSLLLLKVLL